MSALDLRGVRGRRRLPPVNITSLIDVLFLLLIFFMVSSTFIESPALQLDLPEAETAEAAQRDSLTITLSAAHELFVDGQGMAWEDLPARLAAAVAADPDLTLILEADQTVDYGTVIRAIDLARKQGVKAVSALTRGEGTGDP